AGALPLPIRTRVYPSSAGLNWPKSDKSDFGRGEGWGEGVRDSVKGKVNDPQHANSETAATTTIRCRTTAVAALARPAARGLEIPPADADRSVHRGFLLP